MHRPWLQLESCSVSSCSFLHESVAPLCYCHLIESSSVLFDFIADASLSTRARSMFVKTSDLKPSKILLLSEIQYPLYHPARTSSNLPLLDFSWLSILRCYSTLPSIQGCFRLIISLNILTHISTLICSDSQHPVDRASRNAIEFYVFS